LKSVEDVQLIVYHLVMLGTSRSCWAALLAVATAAWLSACAGPRCPAPAAPADDAAARWSAAVKRATEAAVRGDAAAGIADGRRALAIAEASFGPDDRRLLQSRLELASLLLQTGAKDESARLATAAHGGLERALAEAQGQVATSLKFLGTLAMLGRDLATARTHFQRAVELSEQAAGPSDPETAKHLGNLATILTAQGHPAEAEELLLRAMAIWDATPAPHPVYTVQIFTGLAKLKLQRGATAEGLELFARGLAIQERAWGATSPRLRPLLRDYAEALRAAGRTAEADALDRRRDRP
jgi:tetratricopeptide (TPR) repeat protein